MDQPETSGAKLFLILIVGLGIIFFVIPKVAEWIFKIFFAFDLFMDGPYAILFPALLIVVMALVFGRMIKEPREKVEKPKRKFRLPSLRRKRDS